MRQVDKTSILFKFFLYKNFPDGNTQDVHVVQTLTCSLGSSTYKTHLSMATVCKVSRSVIFPPQFKSLQEWFHYAFAISQIDGKLNLH